MSVLTVSTVRRIALAGSIAAFVWVGSRAGAQIISAGEDPALAMSTVAVAAPTTEPSSASAAPPPAPQDQARPDSMTDNGNMRGHNWFNMPRPDGRFDFPSPAEWQNVSAFMKEHSPRRWAFYSSLPDGHRKSGMMLVATRAYRSLQKAQQDDPALAAVVVQRVEAEDAVFAAVTDLRQAKKSDAAGDLQMYARVVRDKVAALVDIGFKERQMRIDQLQKTLDDLKTRLASDQQNRDSVIADRVHSAVSGQRLTSPNDAGSDATHADVLAAPTAVNGGPTR